MEFMAFKHALGQALLARLHFGSFESGLRARVGLHALKGNCIYNWLTLSSSIRTRGTHVKMQVRLSMLLDWEISNYSEQNIHLPARTAIPNTLSSW
jgi:hypothetical protein